MTADLQPGNYWYFALLLVLPVLALLYFSFQRWREKRRNIFADEPFRARFFVKPGFFSKIFPYLYFPAVLLLVLSIVDLVGGSEQVQSKQSMSNVIFLFDVSNSMNAEDIKPNRLTQAKNIISDELRKITNSRVGIVVFAGEATSIMPLTNDLDAADTYIDAVDTGVMKIQGTDFLKAMQVAVQKFSHVPKGSRKVVIISDGEDNEGNEGAAIKLAKNEGISVTSVGVGTDEGAPIPDYMLGQLMGYKTDAQGQTVISKRMTAALKDMAEQTGGTYIDGNNTEEAVAAIAAALKKSSGSSSIMVKSDNSQHYYQYLLAPAVLLFLLLYLFNPKRDLNN